MRRIIRDIIFLIVAAAVILPTPTLVFAWLTGQTITQILYR